MVSGDRVGSYAWTQRTRGALSPRERRRLFLEIVRGQAQYVVGRVRFATGRAPAGASFDFSTLSPPDSAFAREAEEACEEQSGDVIGHSYRTWAFGTALADLDGVALDPELFYVSSLLHDHGIEQPVAGEDFTLRSAARAGRCAEAVGTSPDADARVRDAITLHATPGITAEEDGPLGMYVQAGAVYDLAGIRAGDLPRSTRRAIHTAHPRGTVDTSIKQHIKAEAEAVPAGRFALLDRCGFRLLVGLNPVAKEAR